MLFLQLHARLHLYEYSMNERLCVKYFVAYLVTNCNVILLHKQGGSDQPGRTQMDKEQMKSQRKCEQIVN